jgi:rRNA maturation RNase YbeY
MRIEITNQQDRFPLNEPALERYVHWIMEQVQDLAPEFHWAEISVVCTDDSIRALNREWCGRDKVTDVISFAYPDDGMDEGDTGEVIVNLQQAHGEGALRVSADRVLALYLAHGCHHLMGAEDNSPDRKRAMLRLEEQWLAQADALGLLGPFFA